MEIYIPVTDRGKQSQACYSSMQAQEQHPHESSRSKWRGMKQNTLSFPAAKTEMISDKKCIIAQTEVIYAWLV
jgi:hypothetical protein